jgi:hypothetical protein
VSEDAVAGWDADNELLLLLLLLLLLTAARFDSSSTWLPASSNGSPSLVAVIALMLRPVCSAARVFHCPLCSSNSSIWDRWQQQQQRWFNNIKHTKPSGPSGR